MNKKLHFATNLVPLVISGKKTSTWRLWDDKNLQEGDILEFLESGTKNHFALAKIIQIKEKPFKNLTKEDKTGHENFPSEEEMYKTYTKYYKKEVGPETLVKVIKYKILNKS